MKTVMPLTAVIAMLALSACGDDSSTSTQSPAQGRSVEAPATDTDTDVAKAPAKVGDVTEVTAKAPTPMPEPEDPIIAFQSQDGKLSLARGALTMVSPVHDAETDVWSVFVQLDKEAAEDFYTLTTETTGEALAVVVDEMTVSTPVLETAVYGGGFVFRVDSGEVASTVVATLTGEKSQPVRVSVDAEEALSQDAEGGADTAAGDAEPEEG